MPIPIFQPYEHPTRVSFNQRIEAANEELEGKQGKLSGTQGQVVGFDANGNAFAQTVEFGGKPYHVGTTPPSDTRMLWIDTTPNTGGLKYHNGTNWVSVPVNYT